MQSCLEKLSMEERHEEIVRSDYNQDNQYSVTHPDALGNSGQQGKGTGHPGGSVNLLPHCTGNIGIIDYSNWDTDPESHAGNCQDNLARETMMARSLYNANNPYSLKLIDRILNINEGQYVCHSVNLRQENCSINF